MLGTEGSSERSTRSRSGSCTGLARTKRSSSSKSAESSASYPSESSTKPPTRDCMRSENSTQFKPGACTEQKAASKRMRCDRSRPVSELFTGTTRYPREESSPSMLALYGIVAIDYECRHAARRSRGHGPLLAWLATAAAPPARSLEATGQFHFEAWIGVGLVDQPDFAAMAANHAARHPRTVAVSSGLRDSDGALKTISTSDAFAQYAGPDRNHFLLKLRQRLLRVHEQVQEYLLELPLRAQHDHRLAGRQIAYPNARAFQSPSRKSIRLRSSALIETGRASTCSAPAKETRRATIAAAFFASAAMAATSRSAAPLRAFFHARYPPGSDDGGQRRLQLVHHSRNQAAHRGQLLRTEKLLLYRTLVQQPDRDTDLIAQMLRQCLLVGENRDPVVLVELQHPDHFPLRDHGHKEQAHGCAFSRPWPAIGNGLRSISGITSRVR